MIITSPIDELRASTRAQTEAVSKGWWVLLLTGVVSIVAGGIIVFVDWTVDDLVVFVGTLLIVRGAFTMFSIPVDGSLRTWSVALGVVEIFVGIGVFAGGRPLGRGVLGVPRRLPGARRPRGVRRHRAGLAAG